MLLETGLEATMNIIDKLLALRLVDDLTETSLWADTVYRELERELSGEQGTDSDLTALPPAELS